MASLTLRSVKGTPLTNSEVDANFSNLNTELATKQATLVSGTSIKTVNGVSVLGSGNIQIDGGVTSFNSRTGAVTLSSVDVTGALGFTPYNATNPSGYVTAAGARGAISVTGAGSYDSATGVINIVGGVTSFNTRTGAITLSSADVTTALGFTPYNNTNPSGYITGITSTMVTTALGFTPYNSSNPNGYISSITSANVTTALGFTPYNATNPSGYITSSALSGYLTSASAASTYLPLSGGTLTGVTNLYAGSMGNSPALCFGSETGGPKKAIYLETYWLVIQGHQNEGIKLRTTDATGITTDRFVVTTTGATINGNTALHAGNYNSYAPTLTGTGASGTWGINVTGNANSASTLNSGATINGTAYFRKNQTAGDYTTASLWTESYGNTSTGIAFHISGVAGRYLEMRNNSADLFWQSAAILNAGNYSSYAMPSGSSATNSVDVRAPIFYDSNNTGYYVDPASTSRLSILEVGTGPGGNNAGNLYIKGNNSFRWIAGYAPDYGVGNGFGLYSDSLGAYYTSLSTSGNWYFGVNDHNSSYRVSINGTGYATSDLRAPIFYDSNDTGYYIDPTSTSNTALRMRGGALFGPNTSWGQYLAVGGNGNWNTGYASVATTDGNLHLDAKSGNSMYLNYYAGSNVYFGNGASGGIFAQIASDGTFRSPVFYDYGDTARYVDPTAATSAVFTGSVDVRTYNYAGLLLNASGTGSAGAAFGMQQITGEGWTGLFVDYEPYTGWGLYHDNPNNFFCVTGESTSGGIRSFTVPSRYSGNRTAYEKIRFDQLSGDIITGAIAYAYASMRSPIFYDYDDTGYYCNPNSFSQLSYANLNAAPGGRTLSLGGDQTDRVYGDAARASLVINATQYPHLYINATTNINNVYHGAVFSMTGNLTGGGYRRWGMGIANTDPDCFSWGYADNNTNPHYSVGGVFGYTGTYSKMWLNTGGSLMTTGDMRAPIFYDSNDTAYYVDPNSSGTCFKGYGTVDSRVGFTSIGNPWGTANSAYFPNGITTAGGTNWIYGNSYIGNAPSNGAGHEFQTNGNMRSTGEHRASIYYDDSNTAFYVDPAGTSVLNVLSDPALSDSKLYLRTRGDTNHYLWNASDDWEEMVMYQGTGFRVTSSAGGGTLLYCYGSTNGNYVYTPTSFRAPIFYDANDTTYYCDPATFTYLGNGIANSGGHGSSYIYNRLLAANNGAGTGEVRLQMWCSEPGNSWDWAGFGYNVDHNNNTNPPAYYFGRPNTSFGQAYMRFSTSGNWYFYNTNTGGTRYETMVLTNSGNVEANSSSRAPIFYDLNNTGYYADLNSTGDSIRAAGNITAYYSDMRLKTHLGKIENAREKVRQLEGFYYEANELAQSFGYKPRREVGVSAQAVQAVLPEIVSDAPINSTYLTIDYERLTPLLIEAIKEQDQEVVDLRNRVAHLESLINKLIGD